MRVKRAEKYGFCAGVRIADRKVKKFAALGGTDGKILGQVVHNERVVEEMEELGVHTVESLDDVEKGTIVFSAHGVAPSLHATARRRGLRVLDTTCPFVYDIHDEAMEALEEGCHLVFIGDPVPLGGGVGMGLRESDGELRGKFDAAITSMKEDGSLNALLIKWFGEDTRTY